MEKLFSKKLNVPSPAFHNVRHAKQKEVQAPHKHEKRQDSTQNIRKRAPEVNQKTRQEESTPKIEKSPPKHSQKSAATGMSGITAALDSSRFRLLNELLYTQPSEDSLSYFAGRQNEMKVYHDGFALQTTKWPYQPIKVVQAFIEKNAQKFKDQ